MKIALFGATGTIGARILKEATDRGHEVTAISRDPAKVTLSGAKVKKAGGDVLNAADVARAVAGHDVVVSAVGPKLPGGDPAMLVEAARALHQGLMQAKVKRLAIVGGAGSLEVAPGRMLMDSPEFPAAWRPLAAAHYEALKVYRSITDLDWSYLSPAGFIEPGMRTGKYRTGGEQLVVDASGKSYISAEDYAIAVLDELEHPSHIRQRFAVAY